MFPVTEPHLVVRVRITLYTALAGRSTTVPVAKCPGKAALGAGSAAILLTRPYHRSAGGSTATVLVVAAAMSPK